MLVSLCAETTKPVSEGDTIQWRGGDLRAPGRMYTTEVALSCENFFPNDRAP